MKRLTFLIFALFPGVVRAAPPSSDPTVDWLMNQSPGTPTTAPSTRPVLPFKKDDDAAAGDSRPGVITLSDGTSIRGQISTTAEKPIRVWVEADKEYQDIPFAMVKSIEAQVLWERDEREWRFKASGSDVKEYSGKTYPVRETQYKLTLIDGTEITGGVVAPLFASGKTYVLHKRDKGDVGQTLAQLVYIKLVEF